jgi:E3 ubiquitin-protein ligase TRIP12
VSLIQLVYRVYTDLTIKTEERLRERLQGPNAVAAPVTYDIRGGGLFWGVEFDFDGDSTPKYDFKGGQFAMMLQALVLEKGLVIMGFTGGANLQGTKGNHILLSPAYNVTKEEIDKIVDILVSGVEEILAKHKV